MDLNSVCESNVYSNSNAFGVENFDWNFVLHYRYHTGFLFQIAHNQLNGPNDILSVLHFTHTHMHTTHTHTHRYLSKHLECCVSIHLFDLQTNVHNERANERTNECKIQSQQQRKQQKHMHGILLLCMHNS